MLYGNQLVYFVLKIVLLTVPLIDAAKILAVFPTPSISHQVVFRPLTQELAKRGHEVVVITTDPAFPKGKAPKNLTEIDVHDLSYTIWKEKFVAMATGKKDDLYTQMEVALELFSTIFELQMQTDEVKAVLSDRKTTFDLLIVEACVRPTLALSHVYKVPLIQASSLGPIFGTYEIIGAPTHPILYPTFIAQKLNNLSYADKISEIYKYFSLQHLLAIRDEADDVMLKRLFGPDTPTMSELINNVDMVFLNMHSLWEGNYPVPPSVIYMGGLHQKPQKELPKDIKTLLDSSKNGVIYMSFGTNTDPSALPKERMQIFYKVLSQLPYDVLWKWNNDDVPGQAKNIRFSKWFPQSDLLRHPKVKLFITQGGLQSTDETITAGVPVIGIPMLGDQWFNVEKYVKNKIGVRLDLETITEDTLREEIQKVIGDESYRHNIRRLRGLMSDQPHGSLERVVWWTEHTLRHGGARHLRAPAHNMGWSEYLMLDILMPLLIVLLAVTVVGLLVLIRLARWIAYSYSFGDVKHKVH